MPGKGRKVAARQAQVGRRRRRQTREGVATSSGMISAERVIGNDEEDPSSVAIDPAPHEIGDQTSVRNSGNNRGFRPVRAREGQLASNSTVKAEFIRISIMAGALTSVLVILAVLI